MRFSPLPSQFRINEILSYDARTGLFTWKIDRGRMAKAGDTAGSVALSGLKKEYLSIRIDSKPYYAHRLVWLIETGDDPVDLTVDHVDGDGLNNVFQNLRIATHSQQSINKAGKESTGVEYDKRRPNKPWKARFRNKRLGCFFTQEEARAAYLKAYQEYAGAFAHKER